MMSSLIDLASGVRCICRAICRAVSGRERRRGEGREGRESRRGDVDGSVLTLAMSVADQNMVT